MRLLRKLLWTYMPIFVIMPVFFIVLSLIPDRYASAYRDTGRKVFIKKEAGGYTLYRNGRPFFIQGATGNAFLAQLREAGGNTIRTYDTLQLAAVLDEAQKNDIAVIVGLPLPMSVYRDYFYADEEKVSAVTEAFRSTVARYKDHPALLMWCLGNEPVMTWKPGYSAFYKAYNRMLNMIHATDPDHPVTTTIPNFNIAQVMMIRNKVPGLDLISFNTFGKLEQLNSQLKKYNWLWSGPFLVMEWGAYGPWESEVTAWKAPLENTSTKKAEHYRHMYRSLMPLKHPNFLGSTVFFWGAKQEVTPTWFSMFSDSGGATESVAVMKELWKRTKPDTALPRLKYMLIDGKGARDNLMFRPGSARFAEFFLEGDNKAKIASVRWQIMEEDWYKNDKKKKQPAALLDTLAGIDSGRRLLFKAPVKEGPYRIYVSIADGNGNIATANTPFYVLN
ncbi:glycoside hydrolase family 2 TIM barrel-domain containing protein [Chitinophaga sp. YIM B06452]|uniref:glycoside hydrolase family 2 TIM barrel-domain containing protein n=1 Tax=Chitinophaga sp. YIM B06452 TaxID=3082158 RepID=UPI0031FEA3A1